MLLDNGRTDVLADEVGRQALRCIRCSACLNVCPVYERTGGHAYESVYPGADRRDPHAAAARPRRSAPTLPWASTLCGACYEVCPVKIDIPTRARPPARHGRARARGRALDAERLAMQALGARVRLARAATSARSGSRGSAAGRWRASRAARPAARLDARRATCPRSPRRRSASGGVSAATRGRRSSARVRGGARATCRAAPEAVPRALPRRRTAPAARRGRDAVLPSASADYRATVAPRRRGGSRTRSPRCARARRAPRSRSRPSAPPLAAPRRRAGRGRPPLSHARSSTRSTACSPAARSRSPRPARSCSTAARARAAAR